MITYQDYEHDPRFVENEFARLWIQDNILFFIYKSDAVIHLEAAKKIVRDRITFQQEKAYPVFCDIRYVGDVDKQARDFLAWEGSALAKAVGVLTEPPLTKAMVDFYVRKSKPRVPTGVFTEKDKVLEFLQGFL
ncbi:DUF7793 family protein [Sinomicrobium sp. M5D2P17]